MAQRLVTIVDTDVNLATHLQGELARYGLEAEVVVDANDLMTRKDNLPELVVLCIDPKRTGWAVCNRLRKSPALKSIPLIITSAEATEKDFDDHKKLKTRAEEYLHKPFTVESLVDKMSALIALPQPSEAEAYAESAEIEVEGDAADIEVEAEDIGGVEYADEMTTGGQVHTQPAGFATVEESEPGTAVGFANEIDGEVDLETNAAFAAIGLDEPAEGATAHGTAESPFDEDPFGLPDPPAASDVTRPRSPTPAPVSSAPVLHAQEAAEDLEVELGDDVELGAAEEFDAKEEMVSAMPQLRRGSPADMDSAPVHKLDAAELGLAEVARDAAQIVSETPPASAARDDAALAEAKREIDKLRRELEEQRGKSKDAPAAATTFSREREFLNLRETINKKEKEVLDLKDALDSKERQILDSKEKFRDAERKARETEDRSLVTERELVAAREKVEALTVDKDKGVEREKQVKGRLEDTQKALSRAEEEIETWRTKHASDTAALDEKLNQTVGKYREEMGQLRQSQAESLAELKTEHGASLNRLRSEHEAAQKGLRDEHQSALEALRGDHAEEMAQKDSEHRTTLDTELKAAERRQGEAIVNLETKHESAMAEAQGRHKEALRTQTEESSRTLEQAMAEHVAERTQLETDHARAMEMLDSKKAEELSQAAHRHGEAMQQAAEQAAQRQADALAEATSQHENEMKAAREQHARKLQALEESHEDLKAGMAARHATQVKDLRDQHQQTVDQYDAAIAERDGIIAQQRDKHAELEVALSGERTQVATHGARIEELEADLEAAQSNLTRRAQTLEEREARITELEQQSAQYQDQILRAYQRIKSDENIVQRAKKALAIALTLLEESDPKKDEASS